MTFTLNAMPNDLVTHTLQWLDVKSLHRVMKGTVHKLEKRNQHIVHNIF